MIVNLIERIYGFLWGDLLQIPLPGGGSVGISLLIILLIPAGIYKGTSHPPVPGYGGGIDR